MCGITGIVGNSWKRDQLANMLDSQHHRGPDNQSVFYSENQICGLGHNRLSIIDLHEEANQPMADASGRYVMVFNGEIYNYKELRTELGGQFRTNSDSEVLLQAYIKWGKDCLNKLIGMFSFAIWDNREHILFAARDRLGVKPFNYAFDKDNNFLFASEIKALHQGGIDKENDTASWASYLAYGRYDVDEFTFWNGIKKLQGGHYLIWKNGSIQISQWYNLAEITGNEFDTRPIAEVTEEYFALMQNSVDLRFRADVPVGINLSGGLDSSALLALVDKVKGAENDINVFTFVTGDAQYDELPWVEEMLAKTHHPLIPVSLNVEDIPSLAESVQYHQDEPFGGFPTLAYANIFTEARKRGVIVLLDGQGMDEQWAGYDYYRKAETTLATPTVQGTKDSPVLIDTLHADFIAHSRQVANQEIYPDKMRNLQYRDAFQTKIPRALRFNDRVSMRASTELREPFLDHRLFEIAFRQPEHFKIQRDQGKYFMRQLLAEHLPGKVVEAPKRALQTPQREWLRGPLREWAQSHIDIAKSSLGDSWLKPEIMDQHWNRFLSGQSDNSFYIWQWISLSLMHIRGNN